MQRAMAATFQIVDFIIFLGLKPHDRVVVDVVSRKARSTRPSPLWAFLCLRFPLLC
jgi:hypothetical protein